MSEDRGPEFYRERAEDMRRQAERAISPQLREIYLRLAQGWQDMALEVEAAAAPPSQQSGLGAGA